MSVFTRAVGDGCFGMGVGEDSAQQERSIRCVRIEARKVIGEE